MSLSRGLAIWIIVMIPGLAIAGNDDEILVGNDAALTAGALTAMANDGSAAWFNPAGVAASDRFSTLDVSGNAFILRRYHAPDFLTSNDGQRGNEGTLEFVSVPNALTYVRPLSSRVSAGLGIFVTKASDLLLQSKLTTTSENLPTQWQYALSVEQNIYHVGATVAWRISDRVRVGGTLFGVYDTAFSSALLSGGVNDLTSSPGFFSQSALTESFRLGFRFSAGAQIDLTERLHMGVSVMSPAYLVLSSSQTSANIILLNALEEPIRQTFVSNFEDPSDEFLAQFAPSRVRFGWAYGSSREWVSIDVDVQSGSANEVSTVRRRSLWNVRAGGRMQLWPGVTAGMGVFTDLAPSTTQRGFAVSEVDYFGGTLGVTYDTAYELAEAEKAKSLTFSTTVAVRYAYGFGDVGGLRVGSVDTPNLGVLELPVKFSAHEFGLHLGSALYF